MKKLTIKQAAKRLDFNQEYEFIQYMNDTYIYGQFTQLKRLFSELSKDAKKIVLLNADSKVRDYLIINVL